MPRGAPACQSPAGPAAFLRAERTSFSPGEPDGFPDRPRDNCLEVLRHKPGALPGATALAQARRAGVFTAEHGTFWSAARRAHGDGEGIRELVEVLLLHRRRTHAQVTAGIAAALAAGAVRADVVTVEVRRITQDPHSPRGSTGRRHRSGGEPDPGPTGRPRSHHRRAATRPPAAAHRIGL